MFIFLKRLFLNKFLLKNQFESLLLRKIFKRDYNIDVGLYSYGCFDSSRIASGTIIGRYCSIAPSAYIFSRNHGLEFISLHPFLYNSSLKVISKDTINNSTCIISDDVWLGHNSIILPSVDYIGRGAVIAAGSVVTKNIPPYAVVAGNPAKVLKFRFSPEVIFKIEQTKWWLKNKEELTIFIKNNDSIVYNPGDVLVEKSN